MTVATALYPEARAAGCRQGRARACWDLGYLHLLRVRNVLPGGTRKWVDLCLHLTPASQTSPSVPAVPQRRGKASSNRVVFLRGKGIEITARVLANFYSVQEGNLLTTQAYHRHTPTRFAKKRRKPGPVG